VTRLKNGEKILHSVELDQTSTPDPVSIEMCKILHRLKRIEKELNIEEQFKSEELSVNQTTANIIRKLCEENKINNGD
jgi:hypothetical protein